MKRTVALLILVLQFSIHSPLPQIDVVDAQDPTEESEQAVLYASVDLRGSKQIPMEGPIAYATFSFMYGRLDMGDFPFENETSASHTIMNKSNLFYPEVNGNLTDGESDVIEFFFCLRHEDRSGTCLSKRGYETTFLGGSDLLNLTLSSIILVVHSVSFIHNIYPTVLNYNISWEFWVDEYEESVVEQGEGMNQSSSTEDKEPQAWYEIPSNSLEFSSSILFLSMVLIVSLRNRRGQFS